MNNFWRTTATVGLTSLGVVFIMAIAFGFYAMMNELYADEIERRCIKNMEEICAPCKVCLENNDE